MNGNRRRNAGPWRGGVRPGYPGGAGQGTATAAPSRLPIEMRAALGDHVTDLRSRYSTVAWSVLYVGFLLYVFVITTYQFKIGDVAVCIALLGLLIQREPFRFPAFLLLFALLLVWCALGLVQSRYPALVEENLIETAKLGLILVTAVNSLRTRAQIQLFLVFWVVCFVLYPVRGAFVNYFVAGYSTFGRVMWNYIYANPNDLAAFCLLQLSIASGLLITAQNRWIKRGALSAVVMLILLIVLTQSRSGFLGLLTFSVFALLGTRRRLRTLAIMVVAGGITAMVAPSSAWERFGGLTKATDAESLSEVDKEGSAEQRYAIWQTSWEIIADHPIFGVGWGAYPEANGAYAPMDGSGGARRLGKRDTHSTYFNVTAELGYPGLFLFASILLSGVLVAERTRRRYQHELPKAARQLFFLELGLLGFLVSGIFGSYSRLAFLYLHITVMYALSKACEADHRSLQQALQHQVLLSRRP